MSSTATQGRVPPPPLPTISTVSAAGLWIFAAATAALLVIDYPILARMVQTWSISPDDSHGFVIAPLAIYFAWQRRNEIARTRIAGSWWGLLPLALSLVALAIGRFGVELMNMRLSFIVGLWGLVLLLLGKEMFRVLRFSLGFLVMMVPLPASLLNIITFPLQLIAADSAVRVLFTLGYPVVREGNILHLPGEDLFIAEACSGLRSVMTLLTLGVVLAYFFVRNSFARVILVVSTIPLAIVVNAARVAIAGILTYSFGKKGADGALHEFQGFATFGAAFVLMLVEAKLLNSGVRWLRQRRAS